MLELGLTCSMYKIHTDTVLNFPFLCFCILTNFLIPLPTLKQRKPIKLQSTPQSFDISIYRAEPTDLIQLTPVLVAPSLSPSALAFLNTSSEGDRQPKVKEKLKLRY